MKDAIVLFLQTNLLKSVCSAILCTGTANRKEPNFTGHKMLNIGVGYTKPPLKFHDKYYLQLILQDINPLTLQRGVTGTARMLHALTHSSISRQVREQM